VKICLVEQNEGATEVSGRSGAHLQLITNTQLDGNAKHENKTYYED